MFKDFQWTVFVYLWIHFLGRYKGFPEVLAVRIDSSCSNLFTGTQHLMSIAGQWRYNDGSIGCKNFTRTSFSSTETSYHFFIRATDIRTSSFPFFEWKLGVSLAPLISLKMTSYILMQSHSKMRESLVLFWIQERTWW